MTMERVLFSRVYGEGNSQIKRLHIPKTTPRVLCLPHLEKREGEVQGHAGGLLFRAAEAPTPAEFAQAFEKMKTLHRKAWRNVKTKPKRWARAFFPAHRFDHSRRIFRSQ